MRSFPKISLTIILALLAVGRPLSGGWKIKAGGKGQWTYDSNVFNLSASQAADLRANGPADVTSGRFADMKSVGDHSIKPSFSLTAVGPGLFNRKLQIEFSVDYEFLLKNARRNSAEFGGSIRQSLWKGGLLRISGRYVPQFFRRNYLVDGLPEADGTVLPENRVYAPGVYREDEGRAGLEQRLIKRTKSGVPGLTARLGVGLSERRLDQASFRGRDRNGRWLDAGLSLDFKKSGGLDLSYRRTRSESPTVTEVLLLDEAGFAIDFNGDGDLVDQNVRVVSEVDRSFDEDLLEGTLTIPLGRDTDLQLDGSRRLRRFVSTQPLDGYHGRRDGRWVLGARIERSLGSRWSLFAEYLYSAQTSRFPDVTGDEDDYRKNLARAGFAFRF